MAQTEERLAASRWEDTGYVFTTTVGTPLDASNVSREWQALLEEAGVDYRDGNGRTRGLHALRRTFATALRAQGAGVEEVMRLGRWASSSVLLESYSEVNEDRQRAALDKLADAFGSG